MNEIKEELLPILVTRGLVLYPNNDNIVYVEREFSKNSLLDAIGNKKDLYITCQKDPKKEDIDGISDIYCVATKCRILKQDTYNNMLRVSLHPYARVLISEIQIKDKTIFALAKDYPDVTGNDQNKEQIYVEKLSEYFKNDSLEKLFGKQPKKFYDQIEKGLNALDLSYLFSNALQIEASKKQDLLEAKDVITRIELLIQDFEIIKLRNKVDSEVQKTLQENTQKQQKEYYLREQLRAIKEQLNDGATSEEDKIKDKVEKLNLPLNVKEKVNYELSRLNSIPQGTLEYGLILDYLDTLLKIPFVKETKDNDDLNNSKKVLDDDHYGLEKAKDRILEYLAIKKLNGNLKAPVICFFGPPGTGKTSLSTSIAKALGREFIKCSLGGVSDEGEIRGHRRTYVGSKPGRIISALIKAGVKNPVMCLDEIDKISQNSFKGDPSSALLEVLDPEQNSHFRDNYIEVEIDLSDVLFICTCNYLENVPEPLRDRLELIPIDSYTLLEKEKIAEQHLIRKEAKNVGLDPKNVKFTKDAIEYIIERYTREAGVRDLSRKVSTILRKSIIDALKKDEKEIKVSIGVKEVKKYLGVEIFDNTEKERESQVGIVTGLAYTQYGGDILPIEVNYFEGKGQLVLTGNLGNVMKESCSIALDYVKANASKYGIDSKLFTNNDIHIHVPEGAVPKDGPSAGIAITTAIISALSKTPVSSDVAMTGEVNLRGHALPIGGLREKSLAALRSGIKTIIVPKLNKKNVDELPKEIKTGLNIIYMNNVDDAIKVCFKDKKED